MSDASFEAGYSTMATNSIFDEHRRLAPVTRFSRSATQSRGGCRAGEHTEVVLRELGFDTARIEDLRYRKVVA
jgi:crotonobetainyl-CoA:carnitine CoA-transferase CaiB-like acyl-CoA transferase